MTVHDFEKKHDEKKTYCRKLGHEVPFGYCRKEGVTEPCLRIIGCWIEQIDIMGYVEKKYGIENAKMLLKKEGKDKITSILEILEKTKKRSK